MTQTPVKALPKPAPKPVAKLNKPTPPAPVVAPDLKPGNVASSSMPSGGINSAQWMVIGLLIIILAAELMLHPTLRAKILSFLADFKPAKSATTATQSTATNSYVPSSNGHTPVSQQQVAQL